VNFLENVAEALRPHTMALGKLADDHATKITNQLRNIDNGISDLGRGDMGDSWGRAVINLPGTNGVFTPGLRPQMNQIWLIQSIVITAIPTAAGEAITLVTDSGVVIFTTGRTITTGTGTFSPLDDTVIIGGNIIILPGEHVIATGTTGTTGQIVIHYISKNLKVPALHASTGQSHEEYTGKNHHEPERDEILSITDQYQDPPAPVRASNGLISLREYGDGHLDPTDQ
jgi:hypothetical protein